MYFFILCVHWVKGNGLTSSAMNSKWRSKKKNGKLKENKWQFGLKLLRRIQG